MAPSAEFTITVLQANIQGDIYRAFQPCFLVDRGQERVGRVFVLLTGSAAAIAGARFDADAQTLHEAMARYGMARLEQELSDPNGSAKLFGERQTQEWKLVADQLDELLGPETTDKRCRYQHTEGQDLYCSASSERDTAAVGQLGHRWIAPTSRPICRACALPDTRTLCSQLGHPTAIATTEAGTYERLLDGAWCNSGQDEVRDPAGCHAGGHGCWRRVIVESEPPAPPQASPLAVSEALDFLDAIWRLAFDKKQGLVEPRTFRDSGGLAGITETSEQFELCISDLADALDLIQVPKSTLARVPGAVDEPGSLNRLQLVLCQREETDDARIKGAIGVLQKIRALRHTTQHSGKASERPGILRALGLSAVATDWPRLWDGVRARTVEALLELRTEVRKLTEDEAGTGS